MDVEYISVRGYIRNTPSDTDVHADMLLLLLLLSHFSRVRLCATP